MLLIFLVFGGDPRVFAVGQHYFSEQEYANAFKYFEKAAGVKAAEGGIGDTYGNFSSQAKYQLGVMYYDGLGVEEDPVSYFSPAHFSPTHFT